jgi:histidyl-tRNA synthetase
MVRLFYLSGREAGVAVYERHRQVMSKISAPKGTRDILPPETAAWQHAERVFADVCGRFGYQEIRIPTFEQTELFQRGVGDTTDVVQKEMYTFEDKGGRSMTLRPEGTAGVVRSYLENGMASWPSPVRLFYNITAFRYEKMQKGRYREFHQFGCEAFGSAGPVVDAEMVSLLDLFFRELGLKETSLRINSIGCPTCRTEYNQKLKEYLKPHLDKLCDTCQTRYDKNPLRIIDCKEPGCRPYVQEAPALLDNLCPDCQAHFNGFCNNLDELGLKYTIDKGIVRGLDYYTRTVFEFVSEHVGTQGTICGGGRYDGLVAEMGGQPTPGIGFALGVERLLMELQQQQATMPEPAGITVYIAVLGSGAAAEARRWTLRLRTLGVRAETDLLQRSLKAQLKYAGKLGVRYTVVIGEDEIKTGKIKFKDMRQHSEQEMSFEQAEQLLIEGDE